jgi:hypothetical protein
MKWIYMSSKKQLNGKTTSKIKFPLFYNCFGHLSALIRFKPAGDPLFWELTQ